MADRHASLDPVSRSRSGGELRVRRRHRRQPSTVDRPAITLAATAIAIAMRWSPWLANAPPRRGRRARRDRRPAPRRPRRACPAPRAASRCGCSPSPTSSAASRISVTPSANAAATASAGISSITLGISSPSIVVPCSADARTRSSPTGSPHILARHGDLDVGAHASQHRRRTRPRGVARHRLDHEVGAGRDRGRHHEERGRRRIAGHVDRERVRRARETRTAGRRPRSGRRTRRACARCDRGSAPGDTTSVAPSPAGPRAATPSSPARSRPAARSAHPSAPRRAPPSGARVAPSRPSMSAPIVRSGSTTRPIGRVRNDASPVRTERNGRPASTPASTRMARAAVLAVEHVVGLAQAVDPRTVHDDRVAVGTEPARRAVRAPRRRAHVGAGREIGDAARAVGQRGEDQRAVRDRLVAGHPQPAPQRPGAADASASGSRSGPRSLDVRSAGVVAELAQPGLERVGVVGGHDQHEHTGRLLSSARSRRRRRSRRAARERGHLGEHARRSGTGTRSSTSFVAIEIPTGRLRRAARARRAAPAASSRSPSATDHARAATGEVRVERAQHRVAVRGEDVEPDRRLARRDPRHVAETARREPQQRRVRLRASWRRP